MAFFTAFSIVNGKLPLRASSAGHLGRRWIASSLIKRGVGLGSQEDVNEALKIKEQAGHVRLVWKNGSWSQPEWLAGVNTINLHLHASVLHYGGCVFEGLKAFEQKDGKITMCNAKYNAERMITSANRMGLPEVPTEIFLDACSRAVVGNRTMLPRYESGASLYVRPFLLATGPVLGVKVPCREFTFLVSVQPLGNFVDPGGIDVRLASLDRAAPRGTGHVKVAGNYGASVAELMQAVNEGYQDILYLDSASHSFIDEFHGANFIAISRKNGAIVTPNSLTVLESSTRRMLLQLAKDEGLKVEQREVLLQELLDGEFSEVAACGTSYVVTRIKNLTADGKKYDFGELKILEKLRERFVKIQRGDCEDKFSWNVVVKEDLIL
eukprot:TRINITY_DN1160_c0_g1_i2.p1 TRINITY_DN1160_c0_g1~~TRINITY_DN1160_c0_g1_i2.p1  ORF type:complete len:381 (+),score=42.37 TRINITY_DN1160_c0_g1_i2:167-1309(+)